MVRTIKHSKIGEFQTLGIPLKMDATPSSIRRAPPLLGQHSVELLKEYLDLSNRRTPSQYRNILLGHSEIFVETRYRYLASHC